MFDFSVKKAIYILSAVTIFVYAFSLSNGFVSLDDNLLIYQNPVVTKFNFTNIWRALTSYDPELYVPLTIFTYQFEYLLFGPNPFIFHLTNLILHVGSVILVFLIVLELSSKKFEYVDAFLSSLICTLIFAVHPINVEAVAWAAARKDILSSFLFFASVLFYIKYLSNERKYLIVWSGIFFLLALASKISVILLPFVLILIDIFYRRKIGSKMIIEKIPFIALSIVFGVIAVLGKKIQISLLTDIEKVFLSLKGAVFYVWKLIVPHKLNIIYLQDYPFETLNVEFLIYLVLIVSGLIFALISLKKRRIVFFGVIFYLLMLLPSFSTFWKNGYVFFASDRYPYIAQVGLIFIVCVTLVPFLRKIKFMKIAGYALLVVLGFLTMKQLDVWKNSESLFRQAVKCNPQSVLAHNSLGTALVTLGKEDEAMEEYEKAISLDPDAPRPYNNKGLLLLNQDKVEEAKKEFKKAIERSKERGHYAEDDLLPYFHLATILDDQRKLFEAVEVLEDAVEHGDSYASAHFNLGVKYQQLGRSEEAYMEFKRATEIYAWDEKSFYRFAAVAAETGRLEEAVEALERVQKIHPGYKQTEKHLKNLKSWINRKFSGLK